MGKQRAIRKDMNIEEIKQQITSIARYHKIKKAGVFGSLANGTFNDESDIDILVELDDELSLLDFVRIELDLEDSLRKKVDLVEYKSIKPRLRNRILSEEVRVL